VCGALGEKMSHTFLNIDCMDKDKGMPSYPDKYFNLCICDPPYGKNPMFRGVNGFGAGTKFTTKDTAQWDIVPDKTYFAELQRVSVNQIVWGFNHLADFLGETNCVICWDKINGPTPFADFELAWTSFSSASRFFRYQWLGAQIKNLEGHGKIHPTQKPIALYKWLLTKYAKPGDKILDTHVGSASSIIACIDLGFDVTGFELDKDYFEAASKRIKDFESQLKIF
jgi:site-specific DNA-methyltransferase (adenine-specific)